MSRYTGQSPTCPSSLSCSNGSSHSSWPLIWRIMACSRTSSQRIVPITRLRPPCWRSLVTFFWHSTLAIWLCCHCSTCRQRLTPSTMTRCFDSYRRPTASTVSSSNIVAYGVPLFLLYVADLLQLIKRHQLSPHAYADDIQIYSLCQPSDVNALADSVRLLRWSVVLDAGQPAAGEPIKNWSALVCFWSTTASDPDFASTYRHSAVLMCCLYPLFVTSSPPGTYWLRRQSANTSPPPSDRALQHCVRFGVYIYTLWICVQRCLPQHALLTLIRALVVSKVDYCCSMLAGVSGHLLDRLQSILNAAARLVFSARRSERIILLLRDLHWLRVPEWIQFHLCILAFWCLNGSALPYGAESVRRTADVEGRRHLHSSTTMTLVVPQCSDWLLVTVPFLSLDCGHGTAYHLPSELFHPSPLFGNNWRHICLGLVLVNFLLPSSLLLWLCKVPLHRSRDTVT